MLEFLRRVKGWIHTCFVYLGWNKRTKKEAQEGRGGPKEYNRVEQENTISNFPSF